LMKNVIIFGFDSNPYPSKTQGHLFYSCRILQVL
jgi:hypothetical protein